jgi:hypothetical protein
MLLPRSQIPILIVAGFPSRLPRYNPAYVDVIVRRWELFTGRRATHQASGQSFDARAAKQGLDS